MVLNVEETKEIEELKQNNKKEIMELQDKYAEDQHKRTMKELGAKLDTAKELAKAGLKPAQGEN